MLCDYNILFDVESSHNCFRLNDWVNEVNNVEKKIKITKKGNLKGDDGYKTFSIRIRDDIVQELDNIAEKTNRSRNEVVNIFLDYSVNNWELERE